MSILLFPLLFVAMYVLLIRPQQQRARRQRDLIFSLAEGDQVITAGGMVGEIVTLSDDRATIRLSPSGVEVEFLRGAIAQKVVDDAALDDTGLDHTGLDDTGLDRGVVDEPTNSLDAPPAPTTSLDAPAGPFDVPPSPGGPEGSSE